MASDPLEQKPPGELTDDGLMTSMLKHVGRTGELVQLEMARRLKGALETSARRTERLNWILVVLTFVIAVFAVVVTIPEELRLRFLRWLGVPI